MAVVFLSIHSLIRGWPVSVLFSAETLFFQFTASYEADRLGHSVQQHRYKSFNSQPHTRLTLRKQSQESCLSPFNSQPHTRLTCTGVLSGICSSLSIHSLIRGWPFLIYKRSLLIYLSIHSLIRGWPAKIHSFLFPFAIFFNRSFKSTSLPEIGIPEVYLIKTICLLFLVRIPTYFMITSDPH